MMDDKTKADYERAAVALEIGIGEDNALAFRAFWMAMCQANDSYQDTCNRAARLLRECIRENRELP